MIRLSESLARMRLAEWVEEDDVEEAVRLMNVAMQQSSVDPRTGQIDMDVINTGVSAADRTTRAQMATKLRDLMHERHSGPQGVRLADLIEEIGQIAGLEVSERDVMTAATELQGELKVRDGRVTLVRGE